MFDEIPPLVPVETRPAEIVRPPLIEPPASPTVESPTPERIHLVDAVFTTDRDRQDSMVGLVGLSLTSPWIADLIADHFRIPPEEEEDAPRSRVNEPGPLGSEPKTAP